MSFNEASIAISNILTNTQVGVDVTAKLRTLISQLQVDTSLTPIEKYKLLSTHYNGITLGHALCSMGKLDSHSLHLFSSTGDSRPANSDLTEGYIRLLLSLLDQGIPAGDIFKLLSSNVLKTHLQEISITQLISAHSSTATIRLLFFNLLTKLADLQVSVHNIFGLLNQEYYNIVYRETRTFYSNLRTDINMSELITMLKKALGKLIEISLLWQNPSAFLAQFKDKAQPVGELLQLLPEKYFDQELVLLKKAVECYDALSKNTPFLFIVDNSHKEFALLKFLAVCLALPECTGHKQSNFKHIRFMCDLQDQALIPYLVNILSSVESVYLEGTFNHAFKLLLAAKNQAGNNYRVKYLMQPSQFVIKKSAIADLLAWLPVNNYAQVKIDEALEGQCKVTVSTKEKAAADTIVDILNMHPTLQLELVNIDSHPETGNAIKSFAPGTRKALTLSGTSYNESLNISDASVTSLTIQGVQKLPSNDCLQLMPSFFADNAFLKFLKQMPHLETLILKDVSFLGSATQKSCIEQALQLPRLKKLVLSFPIDKNDLSVLIEGLKNHSTLVQLDLPEENFDEPDINKLAASLDSSNFTLTTLSLRQNHITKRFIHVPKTLSTVLARNSESQRLIVSRQFVLENIATIKKFASDAGTTADLVSKLKLYWTLFHNAFALSQNLKQNKYPTESDAELLCQELACAFAILLEQIHLRVPDQRAFIIEEFNKESTTPMLQRLGDHSMAFKQFHPIAAISFYKPVFVYLYHNFPNLLRYYGKDQKDGENIETTKATLRELIKIVLAAPIENPSISMEAHTILLNLFQQKILFILKADTSNNHQEQIKVINNTKNLSELLGSLNHHLARLNQDSIFTKGINYFASKTLREELDLVRKEIEPIIKRLQHQNNSKQDKSVAPSSSTPGSPLPPPAYVPDEATARRIKEKESAFAEPQSSPAPHDLQSTTSAPSPAAFVPPALTPPPAMASAPSMPDSSRQNTMAPIDPFDLLVSQPAATGLPAPLLPTRYTSPSLSDEQNKPVTQPFVPVLLASNSSKVPRTIRDLLAELENKCRERNMALADIILDGHTPKYLFCRISRQLMLEPGVAADGNHYDKGPFHNKITLLHQKGLPITSRSLVDDTLLHSTADQMQSDASLISNPVTETELTHLFINPDNLMVRFIQSFLKNKIKLVDQMAVRQPEVSDLVTPLYPPQQISKTAIEGTGVEAGSSVSSPPPLSVSADTLLPVTVVASDEKHVAALPVPGISERSDASLAVPGTTEREDVSLAVPAPALVGAAVPGKLDSRSREGSQITGLPLEAVFRSNSPVFSMPRQAQSAVNATSNAVTPSATTADLSEASDSATSQALPSSVMAAPLTSDVLMLFCPGAQSASADPAISTSPTEPDASGERRQRSLAK